jgi:predicted P-loop ATPase
VLTLVGGQNTGKTEWFRRLPPRPLVKYYAESKLDAGKDDDILMCQKLWVMDDEMGGKSKQDEKRFKELTSKSTFSLRAPYGRHNEDYKRLAVLCGTSNEEDIINDPTGNTRILPVRVLSIDHEAYNAIDKDELFMECVRAYESGEEWQLNKSELAALDEMGTDFETTPFERELILSHFSPPRAGVYSTFMTSTDIKDVIETRTKQKLMSHKRFGMELKRIFGKPVSKRINGFPVKAYEVVKLDFNNPTTHETRTSIDVDDDIPF